MLLSTLPWKSCKIKEFIIKKRLLYIKRVLLFQFSLEQQRHTKEQNYFMILYGHVVPSRVVNQTELCCLLTSLRPRVLAAPPRHPGHSDNSPRKHHYLMSLLALCSVKRTPPPQKKTSKLVLQFYWIISEKEFMMRRTGLPRLQQEPKMFLIIKGRRETEREADRKSFLQTVGFVH